MKLRSRTLWTWIFCASTLLWACGDDDDVSDSSVPPDQASIDTGADSPDAERDAGTDAGAACSEEGASRIQPCGMCGTQSEQCAAGTWTPQSECLSQGECAVGQVETEDTALCGQRQRLCLDGCMWGPWSELMPDGECVPGTEVMDASICGTGEVGTRTCNDSCVLGEPEGCDALLERIRIPEGQTNMYFMIRNEVRNLAHRRPTLSTFDIMRYPVTFGHYQECVDAGACTVLNHARSRPTLSAYIEDVGEAQAYCAFVGGNIPTRAQLVRAGRGDCEFAARYAWSDCVEGAEFDLPSCETLASCSDECAAENNSFCDNPVDSTPRSASVFGVERLPGPPGTPPETIREDILRFTTLESLYGPAYDGRDPMSDHVAEWQPLALNNMLDTSSSSSAKFRCVWEDI